jgi:ribonuclease HI
MTLNKDAVNFRLNSLLNSSTASSYKNNERELLSIIKALEELNKENKRSQKNSKEKNPLQEILRKIDIEEILRNIQKEINNSADKERLKNSLKKNGRT